MKLDSRGITEVGVIVGIVVTVVTLTIGLYKFLNHVKEQSLNNSQIATQISDYGFQYAVKTGDFNSIKSVDSLPAVEIGYPNGWCSIKVERKEVDDKLIIKISSTGNYKGVKQVQKKELAIPLNEIVE
jgi:predicted Zn-dependent protease